MWIMLQVQFLGGQVASVLDHKCTHVLVDEKGDLARVAQYDRQFRSWAQRPKVRQRQRERETERDRDRERQRQRQRQRQRETERDRDRDRGRDRDR